MAARRLRSDRPSSKKAEGSGQGKASSFILHLGNLPSDVVPISNARLVDLSSEPPDRADQVLQDDLFQFVPDLRRGREALKQACHLRSLRFMATALKQEFIIHTSSAIV